MTPAIVRPLRAADYDTVVAQIPVWWSDSRDLQAAHELMLSLPRLFAQFFAETSLVAEVDGVLAAFLIGFDAADPADERCYIHFVGTDPKRRNQKLARTLYEHFLARGVAAGRHVCLAVTSPRNRGSIAFHQAMGFALVPGDRMDGDLPVHTDYDGPGQDRVCFRLEF